MAWGVRFSAIQHPQWTTRGVVTLGVVLLDKVTQLVTITHLPFWTLCTKSAVTQCWCSRESASEKPTNPTAAAMGHCNSPWRLCSARLCSILGRTAGKRLPCTAA